MVSILAYKCAKWISQLRSATICTLEHGIKKQTKMRFIQQLAHHLAPNVTFRTTYKSVTVASKWRTHRQHTQARSLSLPHRTAMFSRSLPHATDLLSYM